MITDINEAAQLSAKFGSYKPSAAEKAFHQMVEKRFTGDEGRADRLFGSGYRKGMTEEEFVPQGRVQVELIEKNLVSRGEMDAIDFDLWMEDDRDVVMHILPANGEALFPIWEIARVQIDKVMARDFGDVPGVLVDGNYYGWMSGDISVSRKSDPEDKGRDLFEIRLIRLWTRPHADRYATEALKLYNDVIAGREPIVHV